MRESCMYGSARGALSNGRHYRNPRKCIASLGGAAAVICSRTRTAALPTDRQPSGPADHDLCGVFPRTPAGALCRGQRSVPGLLLGTSGLIHTDDSQIARGLI
jgi:hypothetical protein